MTEDDIRNLLFTINSAYPNFKVADPEKMIKVWADLLDDQDPIVSGMALKHFIRTDKSGFAPSVGQLVQGAYEMQHDNDLTPSEAWDMVYKAICRANYYAEEEFEKFPEAVKRSVGSPAQLRAWGSDPDFNEGVASSNFRRTYAAVCEHNKSKELMSEDAKAWLQQSREQRLLERKEETKRFLASIGVTEDVG